MYKPIYNHFARRTLPYVYIYASYTVPAISKDYVSNPVYPPITNPDKEEVKKRIKKEWHDKINSLPTIEQKIIELNMPYYYGYRSFMLHDFFPFINGLDFIKFATHSCVIEQLPVYYYEDVIRTSEDIATSSKFITDIENLVKLYFNNYQEKESLLGNKKEKFINFIIGLNRICSLAISKYSDHLENNMVDIEPRIEAFWFVGSMQPDNMRKKRLRNCEQTKHLENQLVDNPVQCCVTPVLGVRTDKGLPEVVPHDAVHMLSGEISLANLDPRAYGLKWKRSHAAIIPGFWPGPVQEHSQVFYHGRAEIDKCKVTSDLVNRHILQKALITAFSQALSFAFYQGFAPVTELTYPFTQQTVITDGRRWNFGLYQLNTCALHSENTLNNAVKNILWFTPELTLFDIGENGQIQNLNKDVLKHLLMMYLKKGVYRENPSPYLADYKFLQHHDARGEYKQDFQKMIHHMLSHRPRHRRLPEIYLWEKIYKVDFNTRFYEPPRRWFEEHAAKKLIGHRRLDEYVPPYIPRAQRVKRNIKYKPLIDSENLFKPLKGSIHPLTNVYRR